LFRPETALGEYPQTHVMWRKVASRLAQDFPDLRGYGDSSKPPPARI
jgi:haloacetate dehalogenase